MFVTMNYTIAGDFIYVKKKLQMDISYALFD